MKKMEIPMAKMTIAITRDKMVVMLLKTARLKGRSSNSKNANSSSACFREPQLLLRNDISIAFINNY